jgi:phosphonate ABC transporter substrate-binding protein
MVTPPHSPRRPTPARSATLLFAALSFVSTASAADTPSVSILVLKEHGVGSPSLAQPYLDRFMALAAEQNDWESAKGLYYTNRSNAESFIQEQKPHYAILSLAPFLALKDKYHLEVIGQVAVSLVGGKQYFLISKQATNLAGCKGKTLATDHADDVHFIDKVVAGGKFKLADFTLVPTQRPLQTIKKVIAGETECALVDDAQLTELSHIEGADGVRKVWSSEELPPMVVVAFPNAPPDERTRFQENLARVCDADGKTACAEVGIVSLRAATAGDYGAVLAAYGK